MKTYFMVTAYGLDGQVKAPCFEVAWFKAVKVLGLRLSHITDPSIPGAPAYVGSERPGVETVWTRRIPMLWTMQETFWKTARFLERKVYEYSRGVRTRAHERRARLESKHAELREKLKNSKPHRKAYTRGFSRGFSGWVFDQAQSLVNEMNPAAYDAPGVRII